MNGHTLTYILVLSCSAYCQTNLAKPPVSTPSLEQKLAGTVWTWPDTNPKADLAKAWFMLNADGTTTAGWHSEPRSWRVLSEDTAEVIAMYNRKPQVLRFNADVTEATLDGRPNVIFKLIRREGTGAERANALVLSPSWNTPMQGGTNTMEDLNKLFGSVAKASVNLSGDPSIDVYEGVPYLTPFEQALKPLGITSRPPSKVLIATPGFPRDSLYYYAVDGRFEGQYNRLYVVVDKADQVVSIQLVDETPRDEAVPFSSDYEWSTYNFVNARSKAMSKLKIGHRVFGKDKSMWRTEVIPSNVKMFRVDSFLLNPSDRSTQAADMKEKVRWYVPRPLLELILTCAQKTGR